MATSWRTGFSRTSARGKDWAGTTSRASSCSSSGTTRPGGWRPPMAGRPIERRGLAGFAHGLGVIFGREIGAYFDSSIAYVYASVFLLLSGGIFMNSFFLNSVVDMGEYFRTLPFLLVF